MSLLRPGFGPESNVQTDKGDGEQSKACEHTLRACMECQRLAEQHANGWADRQGHAERRENIEGSQQHHCYR